MKSEYTDAELWIAAAIAAIGGLTAPTNGGSDTAVKNVVDVAGRIADEYVVTFRQREATFGQAPTIDTADDTGKDTGKGGQKAKRAS